MEITKSYENFPVRIVILSNLVTVLLYAAGLIIMIRLGWIAALLYLVLVLSLEYRLIAKHCVKCYYWGKTCGFGQGRLSSLFFKKGDPEKFCENNFSWKDMVPDLLISLIPLITGIVLLIIRFDMIILSGIILLIALTTAGNAFIRGNYACKYCKQRELGCPAEKLFNAG